MDKKDAFIRIFVSENNCQMDDKQNNILTEKARIFCEKNVHDWRSLPESTQQWYIIQVSKLMLENVDVKTIFFQSQLN